MLEGKIGCGKFKVTLTVSGAENKYSKWLLKKWNHVDSIEFRGFQDLKHLIELYAESDCLVFPSRVETWGLPISEFMTTGKPMMLADLPYAHETSKGAGQVAFFPAEDSGYLASLMNDFINKKYSKFMENRRGPLHDVAVGEWADLFRMLMEDGRADRAPLRLDKCSDKI